MAQIDISSPVSEREIAEFQQHGATVVRQLISPGWIEQLRSVFDALADEAADNTDYYSDAAPSTAPKRSSLVKDDVWMHHPVIRRFLFESPIAQAAAEVMGSKTARIYEDLLIYKAAGTGTPTPWHQDEPQWPLTGRQISSIWLSLETVTRDTGALRFVSGSHQGPLYIPYVPDALRHRVEADMHHFTGGPVPAVDADPERFPVRCFDTEPGDAIIFHPRALHAALGTDAARPRRTFSIRFLGDDVRWEPKASVFHDWLEEITLQKGDRISGERFPEIWPVDAGAAA